MHNPQDGYTCLIPKPTVLLPGSGEFRFSAGTTIISQDRDEEITRIAHLLSLSWEGTNYKLFVDPGGREQNPGHIRLALDGSADLGEEGYELSIASEGIRLSAHRPAGLFYGVQTFRQMLPVGPVDSLSLPAVFIRDVPRFPWRGTMLDVARHFFPVESVKRLIDLMAYYKLNRLHLHLTDDQGWRIEIKSWPRLTEIGGRTQAGGGGGGYYTQAQYKEIVEYAHKRSITIIPEIDTPGHTQAALASYPELNSSGEAPPLYEGTKVGFSSLWIHDALTYHFLDDVIREISALTPSPYIHIGGDEAQATPEEDYQLFIKRMQEIVISHDKTTVGWGEIGAAEILPGTIAQHWMGSAYQEAKRQGAKIILSPANKTYLDMKYDASTPLGQDWAGLISVKDSYDWEPGTYMEGLDENDILGLEAPLWTETILTMKDIETMVFPRLLGIAELAWSPEGQTWDDYRQRLAAHGRRLESMGVNFFRSADVEWE